MNSNVLVAALLVSLAAAQETSLVIVGTVTVTTTVTPYDLAEVSGDSGSGQSLASVDTASLDSVEHGSAASDSWGFGDSSGYKASGSSGFNLMIYQWAIVLAALCCCCCALVTVCGKKKKKRAKKVKSAEAPAAPAPVEEAEMLIPALMPMAINPVTTSYAAPMTGYTYAAPMAQPMYEMAQPMYAPQVEYVQQPQFEYVQQAPQYEYVQQAQPMYAAQEMVYAQPQMAYAQPQIVQEMVGGPQVWEAVAVPQ